MSKQSLLDAYLSKKNKNPTNTEKSLPPLDVPKSSSLLKPLTPIKTHNVDKQTKQTYVSTTSIKPLDLIVNKYGPKNEDKNEYADIDHQKKQDSSEQTFDFVSVKLNKRQEKFNFFVAPNLLLIGPFDLLTSSKLQAKLQHLMQQCDKITIMDWIKEQATAKNQKRNFKNVYRINDQQFWCFHVRWMIAALLQHTKQIKYCIRMLPSLDMGCQVILTRRQIFLLIACMFLGIIPDQNISESISFAELMSIRQNEDKQNQKVKARLQKLKCVISYLKVMSAQDAVGLQQKVIFRRIYNDNKSYLNPKNDPKLTEVRIHTQRIEQAYGQGVMIDFANAKIGGGFLTNGCAQQQIFFSIFPQLIVTRLLCEKLQNQQALIIQGARRFNCYSGYSYKFKYQGSFDGYHQPQKSIIVAVDALDFKGMPHKSIQFSNMHVKRQIHKMFLGLNCAKQYAQMQGIDSVYTGKWGCGVYGGDLILKFCLQWIACTLADMKMCFSADDQVMQRELQLLVGQASHLSVFDMFSLIQSYASQKPGAQTFLDYLKQFL